MKHFPVPKIVFVTLLAGFACATAPAFAASKCDNRGDMIEQRACAKAAEGPDALRRFVQRTRMIYALYYYDFAPGEERSGATAAPTASTTVADATLAKGR